jgi:hypothetical protein
VSILFRIALWGVVAGWASGCASITPPGRLAEYVGPPTTMEEAAVQAAQPMRAGLVLIADASAPDAAPSPPAEALKQLGDQLAHDIRRFLPLHVEAIVPAEGIKPGISAAQLSALGLAHGLDYLVVAVASSTEVEYPIYVFLGWTSHMQPGLRVDNWSLVEVALWDVKGERPLLRAEGRGWATLDSPTAPGINQWYPVVYFRPMGLPTARRYWPPTFESGHHTLRGVAMQEAAKYLIVNLLEAWSQHQSVEPSPPKG